MSLLNKVNFKKGWPNPSISELVLPAASGVTTLEAGMVGRRDLNDPEGWVLGITSIDQTPFIFRNDQDDPDAARAAHEPNNYRQVPFGGIQGIGFDNALIIETTQWDSGSAPSKGDLLHADTDGLLKTAASADIAIATCTEAPYYVGKHYYIEVVPLQQFRAIP